MRRERVTTGWGYRWVGFVLAGCFVLAACGGDGDGRDDGDREPDASDDPVPDTTQPVAGDEVAVRPFIEDLLSAWDETMTDVLADPRLVAEDPEHELAIAVAEVFTEDSPYVRDLSLLMGGYVEQDTGIHPGPSGLAQRSSLLHFTQAPDDDHVSFVFCSFEDGVEYQLSDGSDRPPSVGIVTGAGDATRVEGVWRLHRLRQLGLESEPVGTPDPCPGLVESEGSAP